MVISYERLWKLLRERGLLKKDLVEMADIGRSSITKLVHNGNINMDVLVRICNALHCELWDIMELVPEEKEDGGIKWGEKYAEIKTV